MWVMRVLGLRAAGGHRVWCGSHDGWDSVCGLASGPAAPGTLMDTITPPGLSQSTELDPTPGPVMLHGVVAP